MNIIISGYGRMGKEVEKASIQRNHMIIGKFDKKDDWCDIETLNHCDVVIDFSQPDVVIENIYKAIDKRIPIVTGTTGWYKDLAEVENKCKKQGGSLFYAPNFSLGVNIFFRTNEYLAHLMNITDNYQVSINETHHMHKLDAPSGTALTAANGIIKNNDKYKSWSENKGESSVIPISSFREGEVIGTHEVIYSSSIDQLSIKHEAFNRSGFALGSVIAAEFLFGKKGVYTMDDLMNSLLEMKDK